MNSILQKTSRNKPGIYKITSENDFNKIYIGSSIDVSQRIRDHKSDLRVGKHKNKHLQNQFNKYHDLTFSLITLCPKENLLELEQLILDEYCEIKEVFNVHKICVSSHLGMKHTEESKRKMSEKMKGRPGYWTGKKRDKETLIKIATTRKLRGIVSGSTGTKRTDEFKTFISLMKRKWIIQSTLEGVEIARFHGIKNAAKQLGVSVNCISKGLRKGYRHGFKWTYLNK